MTSSDSSTPSAMAIYDVAFWLVCDSPIRLKNFLQSKPRHRIRLPSRRPSAPTQGLCLVLCRHARCDRFHFSTEQAGSLILPCCEICCHRRSIRFVAWSLPGGWGNLSRHLPKTGLKPL